MSGSYLRKKIYLNEKDGKEKEKNIIIMAN